MKSLKFRAYDHKNSVMFEEAYPCRKGADCYIETNDTLANCLGYDRITLMQYTAIKDKNGVRIYEGDILQFSDKWEWYKCHYGPKLIFADEEQRKPILADFKNEPYERRSIAMPECYEWMLSSEIQAYWEVIGNIYQHSHLLDNE